MKAVLKVSLVVNLGLLGCLLFLLTRQPRRATVSAPVTATKTAPPAAIAITSPTVVQQEKFKPFRWNQLQSPDYQSYIKNLRNIGCPEPTLRAIVTADVDNAYRRHSDDLERKLADLAGSSWSVQLNSYNEQQALKAELQKLPDEQSAEIDHLLGSTSLPVQATSNATTTSAPAQSDPVLMPLVFQNVDLTPLNLNEDQKQAIDVMRQQFIDKIGGLNQDPNDPAYLERWQKAQPEIDDMMQGMLGMTAFENYQLAAAGNVPKAN